MKGALAWLIGIPIPIIIVLYLLLELTQGVVKSIAVTHVYTWQTDHLPFSF